MVSLEYKIIIEKREQNLYIKRKPISSSLFNNFEPSKNLLNHKTAQLQNPRKQHISLTNHALLLNPAAHQ